MLLSYERENRTKSFHNDARFQRDTEQRGCLPGPCRWCPWPSRQPGLSSASPQAAWAGPACLSAPCPRPGTAHSAQRLGWGIVGAGVSTQQMTPKESKPPAGLPSNQPTKGAARDQARVPPGPPSCAALPCKGPHLCTELAHPPASGDAMLPTGSLNVTSASRHPLSSVPTPRPSGKGGFFSWTSPLGALPDGPQPNTSFRAPAHTPAHHGLPSPGVFGGPETGRHQTPAVTSISWSTDAPPPTSTVTQVCLTCTFYSGQLILGFHLW